MNRTPPKPVRTELAREVGFGCPVEGCGNPYLMWHHFDPPWRVREHHEPEGMVALCKDHHGAADVGAYTRDQLIEMKQRGRDRAKALQGRFEWRRHRLLAVVGGSFYYDVAVIIQLREDPVIWFNRDQSGYVLLNVNMPAAVPEPRLMIDDNFWIEMGDPATLECPPSGRIVSIAYNNGDRIRVEFLEIDDGESFSKRYPWSTARGSLETHADGFPVTAVEVHMRVHGPDGHPGIDFDPRETRIGGITVRDAFMTGGAVAYRIG